jgi:hypothetical protein
MYVGVDIHYIDPHFLDLSTSWRWAVSFTPRLFYPRERDPVNLSAGGGWTTESVWTTRRSEHSRPYRDSNSDLSVVQPVASRYTDCAILLKYLRKILEFLTFLKSYVKIFNWFVFWVMATCSNVGGGTRLLQLEAIVLPSPSEYLQDEDTCFPQNINSTRLHGVTFLKTVILIMKGETIRWDTELPHHRPCVYVVIQANQH